MKIRVLQPVKVYDKEKLKSPPIFELEAGTEVEMGKAMLFKPFTEIALPDGRTGVMPSGTKILNLELGLLTGKVTAYSGPSLQSEIKTEYKYGDHVYIKDYVIDGQEEWAEIQDLWGNDSYIKFNTPIVFQDSKKMSSLVSLVQESVKVYEKPSSKSEVMIELKEHDCFFLYMLVVVKSDDKRWVMIKDLLGDQGFIEDGTRVNYDVNARAKSFSQFLREMNSGYAFQDKNPLTRINEHKEALIKHIKANKDCFAVIIFCGYADANWLLQTDMVDDSMVQFISERACGKASILKSDDRGEATVALIAIEKARKNGMLVPDIIQAYRTHFMAELTVLAKITWDDRVVDFFIEQLDEGFRWQDYENSSLWVWKNKAGSAQKAAEALMEMGIERGVKEIVPHVLEYVDQQNKSNISGEMESWCAHYGETLAVYIAEGLKHKNANARLFAVKCLARIGNKNYAEVLSNLRNDPDSRIRNAVDDALMRLE